jgi:hypothetical protein
MKKFYILALCLGVLFATSLARGSRSEFSPYENGGGDGDSDEDDLYAARRKSRAQAKIAPRVINTDFRAIEDDEDEAQKRPIISDPNEESDQMKDADPAKRAILKE